MQNEWISAVILRTNGFGANRFRIPRFPATRHHHLINSRTLNNNHWFSKVDIIFVGFLTVSSVKITAD